MYTTCLKIANTLMVHTKGTQKTNKIIQKFITLADKYSEKLKAMSKNQSPSSKQVQIPKHSEGFLSNTLNYYKKINIT